MARRFPSRAMRATLWQALRFAGVGVLATLVHVGVALLAKGILGLAPITANGTGFVVAFLVSFIGHARFTFRVGTPTRSHMRRFFVLSLMSLVLSTIITVTAASLGASFALSMGLVGLIVPAASYFGARFWAFAAHPAPLRTAA